MSNVNNYRFKTGEDILDLCKRYDLSIGELSQKREVQVSQINQQEVYNQMKLTYEVMKASAKKGIVTSKDSMGKLIGHSGKKMYLYSQKKTSLTSSFLS